MHKESRKDKKETFEEYMMKEFMTFRPLPLKDDIEYKFDIWFNNLDNRDYQDYLKDYKSLLK